jgi:sugar phosphate isomerase/epimerase
MKTLSVILILFFGLSQLDGLAQNEVNGGKLFSAPLGVQAYSFRNYFPKDVPGTLDRIQAMGITEIEGGNGRISPDDYRRMCAERGISIPSTGTGFKNLEEDPQKVADIAKTLGAKYVMCAWVPHEKGQFSKDDADKVIKVFNNAGKVLADNGLTFCYHPHGYELQPYGEETLLDYIIKQTNPKYVSYEMDIFWIQFGGGDPVALLRKYGDRWKLMHLKDMKHGTEKDLTGLTDDENNVPIGTGEIDMKNILIEAKKIGIAHYFIEDESSTVVDQIPKSIAYLRSLTY